MDFKMEMQERIDNGMNDMDAYYDTRDSYALYSDIDNGKDVRWTKPCSCDTIPVCSCTCDSDCECKEQEDEDSKDFMGWYCGS